MSAFDPKKKNNDLRTLTEKEIQSKLYGRFFTDQPVVDGNAYQPAKPSPQPEAVKILKPAEPAEKKSPSFSSTKTAPPKETSYSYSAKNISPQPSKASPSPLSASLRLAGLSVLRVGQMALAGLLRFALSIDLRKPQMRRALLWMTGTFTVVAIFAGIHLLNLNREAAMKAPRKNLPLEMETLPAAAIPAAHETHTPLVPAPVTKKIPAAVVSAPQPVPPPVVIAKETPYAIQIATFVGTNDAERLSENLKKEGLKSFVKPLRRSGEKTYYCVFIGGFSDYSEAEKNLAEFKKKPVAKPFQDSFIRTLN